MSKRKQRETLDTLWDVYGYEQTIGEYVRLFSTGKQTYMDDLSVKIVLWYTEQSEQPYALWSQSNERDAACALRVHGLIECEYIESNHHFGEPVPVVLVRDWWTKQPLGKLVCASHESLNPIEEV